MIENDTTIDMRERERARLFSNAFVREREREALIDISFKIAHDLSIIHPSRPLVID